MSIESAIANSVSAQLSFRAANNDLVETLNALADQLGISRQDLAWRLHDWHSQALTGEFDK